LREIADSIMFLKSIIHGTGSAGYKPMVYLDFQTMRTNQQTRNQSSGLSINIPKTHYTNTAQGIHKDHVWCEYQMFDESLCGNHCYDKAVR